MIWGIHKAAKIENDCNTFYLSLFNNITNKVFYDSLHNNLTLGVKNVELYSPDNVRLNSIIYFLYIYNLLCLQRI